jgi:Cupin-like domain
VLRGMRRYIISHPNQCDKLALLPMGHASARHSAIDYTQPDLQLYPEFEQAMANEVVLQAGQVLYLRKFCKHSQQMPNSICWHMTNKQLDVTKLMIFSFFISACLGISNELVPLYCFTQSQHAV